jgi:hypothetical protein
MHRIQSLVIEQIPIDTTCATKRQQLMAKRVLRAAKILEQVRLLFESGYQGYVDKIE